MCIRILTGTRGQATPLWAIVLLVAALLLVPVGLVARAAIERSKAQSAADAAALAGAFDGEAEARAVARLNGARVERYEQQGDTVEVVVVIGSRRATARAIREELPGVASDRVAEATTTSDRVAVPIGSAVRGTG